VAVSGRRAAEQKHRHDSVHHADSKTTTDAFSSSPVRRRRDGRQVDDRAKTLNADSGGSAERGQGACIPHSPTISIERFLARENADGID